MPNAPGIPAAFPASSSMWIGTNSSLTAAYRFQAGKPVVCTTGGSSSPTTMSVAVTPATGLSLGSIADQCHTGPLDQLITLVRPGVPENREQHQPEPALAFEVLDQPIDRCDHVAGTHRLAVF